MRQPKKRIKRGEFVRLPNGAGAIAIGRSGELMYKAPAAPAAPKKKNPTKRTAPKAKAMPRRVLRAMASWVRGEQPAPKRKTNGRKATGKKTTPKKGRR